jgi:hypothetical protein
MRATYWHFHRGESRGARYWTASFRVLGYGLWVSNERPYFSERNGLIRCVRILGVKFEFLTPKE